MNNRAHKCQTCKKAFQPTKISQVYCSAKCRQAGYRVRRRKKAKIGGSRREATLFVTICEHCSGSFWTKRERSRFCSTSCRTLYHRAMKAAIPRALMEAYNIPQEKAFDIVETQAIRQVKQLLDRAGYIYCHSCRIWIKWGALTVTDLKPHNRRNP
jgi:hypothetical protein